MNAGELSVCSNRHFMQGALSLCSQFLALAHRPATTSYLLISDNIYHDYCRSDVEKQFCRGV